MSDQGNPPRRAPTRRGAGKQALLLALLLIGAGLLARPAYDVWREATAPRGELEEIRIQPAR